ncbi:hypothetical protein [Halomonas sp. BC04]|uniref:hypothetical protein n=1 Tax=Halomonas sp. BC04 TaxID=1403540 RepID=UPI0003ED8845|nr:hypothetical protein [Halomonas sp. BC04]EWH01795.1 hypothetical protein Q427_12085 [Halomonas sp. BC04]
MIIARWYCQARFGHKQELLAKTREWWTTIGREIGQTDYTITTGSIGAAESVVAVDLRVADLATLSAQWDKLAERADHREWGKAIEPLVVSGSTRWEIYRVVE